jgi:hypothetical protein
VHALAAMSCPNDRFFNLVFDLAFDLAFDLLFDLAFELFFDLLFDLFVDLFLYGRAPLRIADCDLKDKTPRPMVGAQFNAIVVRSCRSSLGVKPS